MPLASDLPKDPIIDQPRASVRLNSRVPVAVEWDEAGQKQRTEGCTVDVSRRGCQAILPHAFTVEQKLRLINLNNQHAVEAIVVWRGHETRVGWDLGLELQNPEQDFWGIDFW